MGQYMFDFFDPGSRGIQAAQPPSNANTNRQHSLATRKPTGNTHYTIPKQHYMFSKSLTRCRTLPVRICRRVLNLSRPCAVSVLAGAGKRPWGETRLHTCTQLLMLLTTEALPRCTRSMADIFDSSRSRSRAAARAWGE